MKAVTPREALSQFVSIEKYSRFLPALNRRETKEEGQTRMVDMHRRRWPQLAPQLDWIEKKLHGNAILGSQRAWQFGGAAIERVNMRSYNCSFSLFDRPDFLKECVWLLLCGCGTGFSVQRQHVAKLPRIRRGTPRLHVVQDSIEGWADAFGALLTEPTTNFDYALVRPEGATLSSTPHPAPGPEPLRRALENCRALLMRVIDTQNGYLRPVDAFDLVMFAAECVRSGGVRRSATIALFSKDDEDMLNAKTGDWWKVNPQRRLANISAVFLRDDTDVDAFNRVFDSTREFGEPGFLFVNDLDHGVNPCVEIGLDPVLVLDDGSRVTGWSMCNLSTVNVASCATESDFYAACEAAALLGTLQAAYTDTTYLGAVTKAILERDALIGVSLTGIADRPEIGLDPHILQNGAAAVVAVNAYFAQVIGIRAAARATCVKPEGTGSLALGGVASGSTPHHAKRYLRFVEGGKASSPLVAYLRKHVPDAVEVSVFNPDEVKIVFPIEVPGKPLTKADVTAVEHLDMIKLLQENWVMPGTNRGTLVNNVSNTVQVRDTEWEAVADKLWRHRDVFAGVALLGKTGDLDYQQAPFVAVDEDDQDPRRQAVNARWKALSEAWPVLDFTEVEEATDQTSGTEVIACGGGACEI